MFKTLKKVVYTYYFLFIFFKRIKQNIKKVLKHLNVA